MERLSVVIATRNEGTRIAGTVRALLAALPPGAEIVVVDDHSADGSTDGLDAVDHRVVVHRCASRVGASEARNLGARLARGSVLLFADAHVEPCSPWAGPMVDGVARRDVGAASAALEDWHTGGRGYGLRLADVGTNIAWLDRRGARPYPVPVLPGFFLAIRREVFRACGGFDTGIISWGMEDIELSVRLWTLGFECVLVPDVVVRHYSKDADQPDYQRDWGTSLTNILRFGATHYSRDRWLRLLDFYAGDPELPAALDTVHASDVWSRRTAIQAVRARDDDALFALCGTR